MRQFTVLLSLICSLSIVTSASAITELIGGGVNFKGTVVARGCSIVPSSKNIQVDFKHIETRTLYEEHKSAPQHFVIELQDCNPAVLNAVTVTFSGTANPNMTDRLAITTESPNSASGIGIGFEEDNGTTISLNTPTSAVVISNAKMKLSFYAFVEGEPDALSNNTLKTGAFQATANYTLNYQ